MALGSFLNPRAVIPCARAAGPGPGGGRAPPCGRSRRRSSAREPLQHAVEAGAGEMDIVEEIIVQLVLRMLVVRGGAIAHALRGLAQAVGHEHAERAIE